MKLYLAYPPSNVEIAKIVVDGLISLGHQVWARYDNLTSDIENTLVGAIKIQEGIESADVFIALLTSLHDEQPTVHNTVSEQQILYAQHRNIPIVLAMYADGSGPIEIPITLLSYEKIGLIPHQLSDGLNLLLQQAIRFKAEATKTIVSQSELEESRRRILESKSLDVRVFIAYSRHQLSVAKKLADLLISHGIPNFWDDKITAGAT